MENDKKEALEHDGKAIPRDYVMAQLSMREDHKDFYKESHKKK